MQTREKRSEYGDLKNETKGEVRVRLSTAVKIKRYVDHTS